MAPQLEFVPHNYVRDRARKTDSRGQKLSHKSVALISRDNTKLPCLFTFEALKNNVYRTTFSSDSHRLAPWPSTECPSVQLEDTRDDGLNIASNAAIINSGSSKAMVDFAGPPIVSIYLAGQETPLHRDLDHRSYAFDGEGVAHYSEYTRDILHVGLGEKAAPMNLSNRGFVLSATDCFGYDIYRTDPMYKHIPLLISASPQGCVGIFSTSHSRGMCSIGSEVDGMWGHFKVYRHDYGGLEEYIMVGKTIQEVVHSYAELVGFPRLVPRWAMGYISGGMKYSMLDEPRACDSLMEFATKLKKHDIPCSAFQMSSGYTVAETEPKTRNVFTWNKHRFPDPAGFMAQYHAEGIRLIANVKPYVLANHPEYGKLAKANALFKDPRTNQAGVTRLWSAGGGTSGEGSHIDFTSKAGYQWWYEGVRGLRQVGIHGIWNDNNEYTVADDKWQCALENTRPELESHGRDVGVWGRYTNTELMAKASCQALIDLEPNVRPYVLTRSATAGTMRYAASTWSGDNVTSWAGMKGANALSLTGGMCLLQCYGHDIGGFEGPQPTPELLVRWVQLGIHSSRFAINCYKTSPGNNNIGDIIEPFMYPSVTPIIRAAIKRRYELLPYLYSLMLSSHLSALPAQRWIGWGCEHDPEVWSKKLMDGEEQFWLGPSLLIGGVYESGVNEARMYLPLLADPSSSSSSANGNGKLADVKDFGYMNCNAPYQYLASGQWSTISSPWNTNIPILAKIGAVIPVGKDVATRAPGEVEKQFFHQPEDDWRGVEIFPPQGSSNEHVFEGEWMEDDGLSATPEISVFQVRYWSTENEVCVELRRLKGKYMPKWETVDVILPVGDGRVLKRGRRGRVLPVSAKRDKMGRTLFVLSFESGEKEPYSVNGEMLEKLIGEMPLVNRTNGSDVSRRASLNAANGSRRSSLNAVANGPNSANGSRRASLVGLNGASSNGANGVNAASVSRRASLNAANGARRASLNAANGINAANGARRASLAGLNGVGKTNGANGTNGVANGVTFANGTS